MKKGAALLGLGINNIYTVPCDENGKMIAQELDRMIQETKDQVCVLLAITEFVHNLQPDRC